MPPSASENERGGKPLSQAEIAAHLTSLWEAVSTEKNPRWYPFSNYSRPRELNFAEQAGTGNFRSNKHNSQLSRFSLSMTSRGCTSFGNTILRQIGRRPLHTWQTILRIYIHNYILFSLFFVSFAQCDLPDKHTN